jgi:hypothetical protein
VPLNLASNTGRVEVFKLLLEKDGDVNYFSDLHGFLLHLLAYKAVYRSIAFDL